MARSLTLPSLGRPSDLVSNLLRENKRCSFFVTLKQSRLASPVLGTVGLTCMCRLRYWQTLGLWFLGFRSIYKESDPRLMPSWLKPDR